VSRRILFVDDEADLRTTIQSALELAGYAVDVAANGREALALQRERPADVLITDIFMPDSDGFEAIDGFRREFPGTKLIIISGGAQFARGDYLSAARLMGVDATLQKPFEIETLLGALRALGL
jgi:CheY-like chemotaxis protein